MSPKVLWRSRIESTGPGRLPDLCVCRNVSPGPRSRTRQESSDRCWLGDQRSHHRQELMLGERLGEIAVEARIENSLHVLARATLCLFPLLSTTSMTVVAI